MRIVSGGASRKSDFSHRRAVTHGRRPTGRARVVFNVLACDWWPASKDGGCLIFRGSGAPGLEAMPRGAAFALFVLRTDAAAARAIRDNIKRLASSARHASIGAMLADLGQAIRVDRQIRSVYAKHLGERALERPAGG